MFDLISIGDSVVDTFIPIEEVDVVESHGEKKLILPLGYKVPVGPSTSVVGGNAANNAVGAARLKLKTSIYTNVGNLGDEKDDLRIIRKFRDEKVDIRYVIENDDLASNHHIVLDYKGERTILVYHQPWRYKLPDLDKTKWVYFTSLSPSYIDSNIIGQLVNYLERTRAKLLFNPGTFQIKQGSKKVARILSLTEVLIMNLEESKLFLGMNPEEKVPIKKLLQGLIDLGSKMAVITDGGEGSYCFDGERFSHLGVFPAKLVESTGAGDAFATGVLAGLFYGENLAGAMRWGAANSGGVVEQLGPQAGLLTYEQMQDRLNKNSEIVAKKI